MASVTNNLELSTEQAISSYFKEMGREEYIPKITAQVDAIVKRIFEKIKNATFADEIKESEISTDFKTAISWIRKDLELKGYSSSDPNIKWKPVDQTSQYVCTLIFEKKEEKKA